MQQLAAIQAQENGKPAPQVSYTSSCATCCTCTQPLDCPEVVHHFPEHQQRAAPEPAHLYTADKLLGAQGLAGWAAVFVQYVQVTRELSEARQAATEPKFCDKLAAVIQACIGRIMELYPYLVRACCMRT